MDNILKKMGFKEQDPVLIMNAPESFRTASRISTAIKPFKSVAAIPKMTRKTAATTEGKERIGLK